MRRVVIIILPVVVGCQQVADAPHGGTVSDLLKEGSGSACAHPDVLAMISDQSNVTLEDAINQFHVSIGNYNSVIEKFPLIISTSPDDINQKLSQVKCTSTINSPSGRTLRARYTLRPAVSGQGFHISFDEALSQEMKVHKDAQMAALADLTASPKPTIEPNQSPGKGPPLAFLPKLKSSVDPKPATNEAATVRVHRNAATNHVSPGLVDQAPQVTAPNPTAQGTTADVTP